MTSTLAPIRTTARDAALEAILATRLLGTRASDRLWGWLGPLAVAVAGGLLRLYHLQYPSQLVFDETYYVKEGASYLKVGYELTTKKGVTSPDNLFTHANPDVFGTTGDFVVHPPVGKWMIALGEWSLGVSNPWGWRISSAVVGTLSILMIGRIARRMFGSTLLGCTAALLLSVDGQHFVHSRTGLLDIFVMFWALAGFGCLVIDRDTTRERLAAKVAAGAPVTAFGPGLGIRWWRIAAAVCLGLCCGTKWSGLWFLGVFALMSVLWDLSARRALGGRRWWVGGLVRDGGLAAMTMLPIALLVYLGSWTGWLLGRAGYDRTWADTHPSTRYGWVPNALRSLWHYHYEMYQFNVTLRADHPYKANPWSWMVLGRPTAFYYKSYTDGQHGCTVASCSRAITALGNPVIWWGGTLAVGVLLFSWLLRRDWRAGAVLAGLLAGYVPWFEFQERTIYSFYAVAFVPWVVLGLTYVLGLILGPPSADRDRRFKGAVGAGVIVLAAVVAFAFFYPIYTAETIPHSSWADRMWLPGWI